MEIDLTKTNGTSPPIFNHTNSPSETAWPHPEEELEKERQQREQNLVHILAPIASFSERIRTAAKLFLRGETLAFIGWVLGVTRERVRQYFSLLSPEFREQWEIHRYHRKVQRRVKPKRTPIVLLDGNRRPEYNCFRNMLQRCQNPDHPNYHDYGGRGVRVCSDWDPEIVGPGDAFKNFMRDMGERPEANQDGPAEHSIHRKDNVLLYSKETCRWATRKEQCALGQRRPPSRNEATENEGVE